MAIVNEFQFRGATIRITHSRLFVHKPGKYRYSYSAPDFGIKRCLCYQTFDTEKEATWAGKEAWMCELDAMEARDEQS